jgi:hypothetical protein
MVIENRSLTPGTRLVASYRKQHYACIVGVEDGKTVFTLEDGRSFKSPSAAGSALMNGMACNGWRFWSVEGEAPVAAGEKLAKTTRAPKAKTGNGFHLNITRKDWQDGSPVATYWCGLCNDAFTQPRGQAAPEGCPAGHPAVIETAEKPAKAPKPKANGEHRAIKRVPNQKGAGEGMTKYFCDCCMRSFKHPTDQGTPEGCPEGHPATIASDRVVA